MLQRSHLDVHGGAFTSLPRLPFRLSRRFGDKSQLLPSFSSLLAVESTLFCPNGVSPHADARLPEACMNLSPGLDSNLILDLDESEPISCSKRQL